MLLHFLAQSLPTGITLWIFDLHWDVLRDDSLTPCVVMNQGTESVVSNIMPLVSAAEIRFSPDVAASLVSACAAAAEEHQHFLTEACASIRTTAGPLCPHSPGSNSVHLWWPQGLWLPQLASHKWKPRRPWYPTSPTHKQQEEPYLVGGLDGTRVFTCDPTFDGVLTKHLAHDCEVGLAEVRRGMRVPPRNIFPNLCVSWVRPQRRVIHSHVVPTKVFPQAHVKCARRTERSTKGGVPEHEPQQATMPMAT